MKTKIILAGLGLLVFTSMKAVEPVKTGKFIHTSGVDYYDEPIRFEEHGIIFYVFLNGDFDFNVPQGKHYGKPGKRYGDKHAYPKGVYIERDRYGKIRRIDNVFISYTYYGKVKRIGSVFIDYYQGRMEYVGNLRIIYGRYGVSYEGSVKGRYHHDDDYDRNPRVTVQYKGHHVTWEYGYYDNFFTSNDFYDKYENYDEDDRYYYFKTKDNDNDSENIIIKRKKENLSTKNESRRKLDD